MEKNCANKEWFCYYDISCNQTYFYVEAFADERNKKIIETSALLKKILNEYALVLQHKCSFVHDLRVKSSLARHILHFFIYLVENNFEIHYWLA